MFLAVTRQQAHRWGVGRSDANAPPKFSSRDGLDKYSLTAPIGCAFASVSPFRSPAALALTALAPEFWLALTASS